MKPGGAGDGVVDRWNHKRGSLSAEVHRAMLVRRDAGSISGWALVHQWGFSWSGTSARAGVAVSSILCHGRALGSVCAAWQP